MKNSAIIIGAGISGLTTAFLLKKNGLNVTVLEAEKEVGGTMKSKRINGYLVELGPNSALETTPLFKQIADEVGISNEMIYANESSNKRYILKNGNLYPIPMKPQDFFKSKLWSWRGKLRIVLEPFHGRAKNRTNDPFWEETVSQFVRRRLGNEFLDYTINPFVAGVYAGDPEKLGVKSAFPRLYALEEKYGGLIIGTIKGAKERKRRAEQSKITAKMFSFINGMGTLPKAIANYLGDSIIFGANVKSIKKDNLGYIVEFEKDGKNESIYSEIVVVSTPAYIAGEIIAQLSSELENTLKQIYYPPVAEVVFGYKKEQIGIEPDGFGFLTPEKEKRKILGTLWNSTIFPQRAPEGYVEFTTFVGGTRQPEIALKSDDELIKIVSDELKEIMKINGEPEFIWISRWEKAIPQYNVGHLKIMAMIDEFEKANPGIYLCANYRGGISVGDCVTSASKIANKILNQK
ncbi:MAG: protoporphyrinogen oxidase [Candidatus Kryptonium sp.]|nr:protoporphyrinogen oxidase [Candidatus Kryptonium sp.]MCX7762018.1 protoporphyrinogen oxidase [Candidatus Kryptonium sp.]MDW8108377.1 protoporphyrinogen oxidase [Candidatus Kryptonium sp.]